METDGVDMQGQRQSQQGNHIHSISLHASCMFTYADLFHCKHKLPSQQVVAFHMALDRARDVCSSPIHFAALAIKLLAGFQ